MSSEVKTLPDCCVSGFIHTGKTNGAEIKLGDEIDCYLSGDEKGDSCLLVLTDVFGHTLNNTRLVADTFQEHLNMPVYVPDIVLGNPIPSSYLDYMTPKPGSLFDSIMKKGVLFMSLPYLIWWMSQHPQASVESVIVKVFNHLKAKGYSKIAMVGYCFGGKHAIGSAGVLNDPVIKAVVSTHPSKFKILEDLNAVKAPVLIQFPHKDFQWTEQQMLQAKDTLEKRNDGSKASIYQGVEHGWAIRSNLEDPNALNAKNECNKEAVDFFKLKFGLKA